MKRVEKMTKAALAVWKDANEDSRGIEEYLRLSYTMSKEVPIFANKGLALSFFASSKKEIDFMVYLHATSLGKELHEVFNDINHKDTYYREPHNQIILARKLYSSIAHEILVGKRN